MKPGVVRNPAPPVELLVPVLPMLHHVLVMSVNPGFGGQEFIPYALDKIAQLREMRSTRGLGFRIEVDGGVAHETSLAAAIRNGMDELSWKRRWRRCRLSAAGCACCALAARLI